MSMKCKLQDDRMSCLVGRLFILFFLIIACPVLGLKMLAEVSMLDRRGDGWMVCRPRDIIIINTYM